MNKLNSVLNTLRQKLAANVGKHVQLSLPFCWLDAISPLEWLDAQPIYPKFYWQSRDEKEESLVLGQQAIFSSAEAAQRSLNSGERVWGGVSFNANEKNANSRCLQAFFFKPAIELRRTGTQWTLEVVSSADHDIVRHTLLSLVTQLGASKSRCNSVLTQMHEPSRHQWHSTVNTALSAIESREIDKVVLARKTTLLMQHPLSAAQLLKDSCKYNISSFHFMMALNANHHFIGSTPERLFKRENGKLETEALAGTIQRGQSKADDFRHANWLLNDDKNLHENQLVVDDILARLNSRISGLEVEQTPGLVRLRSVQHLKREISGKVPPSSNDADLLLALQPTAAVAGLPRSDAMQFIRQRENFDRGWYSGAVGFMSEDKTEFCVAIRSALVKGREVQLFAGAGIVKGSNPSHEWDELDKKLATLYQLIHTADLESLKVAG